MLLASWPLLSFSACLRFLIFSITSIPFSYSTCDQAVSIAWRLLTLLRVPDRYWVAEKFLLYENLTPTPIRFTTVLYCTPCLHGKRTEISWCPSVCKYSLHDYISANSRNFSVMHVIQHPLTIIFLIHHSIDFDARLLLRNAVIMMSYLICRHQSRLEGLTCCSYR